jgi:hypothetical protein
VQNLATELEKKALEMSRRIWEDNIVAYRTVAVQRLRKHVPETRDTNAKLEELYFLRGPCGIISKTRFTVLSVESPAVKRRLYVRFGLCNSVRAL